MFEVRESNVIASVPNSTIKMPIYRHTKNRFDFRLWKKPQNVKEFAKSTVQKLEPNDDKVISWTELSNHPSWNNLFILLENYVNRCSKLEKQSRRGSRDEGLKKVSIRKKYKKYKKRYKLIKNETSRTSDSGYECTTTSQNENPTKIKYTNYEK